MTKCKKKVFFSKNICVFHKNIVPLHEFLCRWAYVPILLAQKIIINIYTKMSKICQITGKKAMIGCNVSHSKRHTKRSFDVNLFRRKFYWVEQDAWIELNVSAAGLRTINKIGLDNALKKAAQKGYL